MNQRELRTLVSGLKVAYVKLTNAEIKALAASNKTLVPAPGATSFLELISAVFVLRAGTNVLTESADNLIVLYDTGGTGATATIETTGFIDQAADTAVRIPGAAITTPAAMTALLNKPLVLDNSGDGEFAGNAALDATMDVYVTYRVHTLP